MAIGNRYQYDLLGVVRDVSATANNNQMLTIPTNFLGTQLNFIFLIF